MATLAQLVVKLSLEAKDFHRQLESVAQRTERLGRQIARAGHEISVAISLPLLAAGFGAFRAMLEESHKSFGPLYLAFEQLKASAHYLFLSLGRELEPTFQAIIAGNRALVVHLQNLVAWFHALDPAVKKIVINTLLFLAALGPTVLIIGKLIAAFGAIPKVLALLTSPLGLIVVAILALAAAAIWTITHWEQVKLRMVLVWTAIKEAVFSSVSAVLSVLETLTGWIPKLGPVIAELRKNFDAMADDSLAKSAKRIRELEAALAKAGVKLEEQGVITNDVRAVVDQYNESVRLIGQRAIALGPSFNMAAAMATVFQARLEGLIKTGNLSVEALQNLGRELLQAEREGKLFADTAQAIQQGVAGAFESLGAQMGQIFAGLTHGFRGFGSLMEGLLGGMLSTLGKVLIAYGVAGLAIKKFVLSPGAAIAAGIALTALGAALSAAAQKTVTAPDTGGGGGGTTATTGALPDTSGQGKHITVLFPSGPFLFDPNDPKQQQAFKDFLANLIGRGIIDAPAA